MDKPNDIIIRYTVYGFLIGIFFPFASLLLHSLTGNVSFTLNGFGYLHTLFPGQFLMDVIPVLTTVAGIIAGAKTASNQVTINRQLLEGQQRSEKNLDFTAKLIHNQLDAELDLKDADDSLGEALINLRNNLKNNTEEQQNRKMEDDQDEVLGILELASFNTIEKFEIGFVESVAERTAITISSLRSSIRTASLLKESQSQAEVMAQQEEKMRQNMEQLKETQEKAAQQAEKFISFTNSVNHTLIRAEYGTES